MDISLINKNALVCGSSQGIGKASAIELALLGANVTLFARNAESLLLVLNELDISKNQKHQILVADFNNLDDIKKTIESFIKTNNIHILVNNSGGPAGGSIVAEAGEKFMSVFQQHLIVNQLLAQSVLPQMKAGKYGRIINIISTSVKQPLKNLGVSNTIRAAVAAWAKTWSFEVASFGITVNNVLPGATATNRLKGIIETKANKTNESIDSVESEMLQEIPMNRFANPHEIANLVAFLATPAASYINGTSIPVDGGRTASI